MTKTRLWLKFFFFFFYRKAYNVQINFLIKKNNAFLYTEVLVLINIKHLEGTFKIKHIYYNFNIKNNVALLIFFVQCEEQEHTDNKSQV